MDWTKKNKNGCYCINGGNVTEMDNGEIICFSCGLVLNGVIYDNTDENISYDVEDVRVSRCNGFYKKNYMSESSNNSGFIVKNKYIQNMLMWDSLTYEDIAILSLKEDLELKSEKYNITNSHIEEILLKYKKLLGMRNSDYNVSFKGRYKRGLLAVFTYCIDSSFTKEKVSEMYGINDDSTFNKCCKIYKDLFGQDPNTLSYHKVDTFTNILNDIYIPDDIKNLIEKCYIECGNFGLFKNISKITVTFCIILFFLKELDYDTKEIEKIPKYSNIIKKSEANIIFSKLNSAKFSIFNEIKNKK